jgi:hypothetical protein
VSERTSESAGERRELRDEELRDDVRRDDDGDGRLTTSDLVQEADEVQEDDAHTGDGQREPLFASGDVDGFRSRWLEIQAAFVDEPRRAVHEADSLVAELMQRLAQTFSDERTSLESQWDRDEDVSTEDLRVALQRYRSFFDRLLSA